MVSSMRILTLSALLSVAAFSALLSGCRNFEKPKYDVDDRRILLVPFRDLAVKHGHGFGESERGKRAVEALRNWTEKNASPDFADRQTTELVVRELREWPKETLTPMDWKKLTIGIDTDLVLLGEIRQLRTTDPKSSIMPIRASDHRSRTVMRVRARSLGDPARVAATSRAEGRALPATASWGR